MAAPILMPLVFTDLDGTLLDHQNYSYAAAQKAIDALILKGVPLIFNTSKTQIESILLSKALGLSHPVIIENGGGIVIPTQYDFTTPSNKYDWDHGTEVIPLGANIEEIRVVLLRAGSTLPAACDFRTFSSMSVEQIQALTGLAMDDAANAKQRQFSEPLEWLGDQEGLEQFELFLKAHKLNLIAGGRFYHVLGETNKCTAMVHLAAMYENSADNNAEALIVALGDSKNDREMLAGADIAVVVKNSAGTGLSIDHKDVIYTNKEGPQGWQEAIEQILPRL